MRAAYLLALPLLAAALAVWLRRGDRKRTAWANETAEEEG